MILRCISLKKAGVQGCMKSYAKTGEPQTFSLSDVDAIEDLECIKPICGW